MGLFWKLDDGDMSITATELKQNLGKYLLLSAQEDIYITKNGKVVAKLTNPHQNRGIQKIKQFKQLCNSTFCLPSIMQVLSYQIVNICSKVINWNKITNISSKNY